MMEICAVLEELKNKNHNHMKPVHFVCFAKLSYLYSKNERVFIRKKSIVETCCQLIYETSDRARG